jgi:hypothetical protein
MFPESADPAMMRELEVYPEVAVGGGGCKLKGVKGVKGEANCHKRFSGPLAPILVQTVHLFCRRPL